MAGFGLSQVPHSLRQQLFGYAVGQAEETAPLLPGLFFHQTFRADGPIPVTLLPRPCDKCQRQLWDQQMLQAGRFLRARTGDHITPSGEKPFAKMLQQDSSQATIILDHIATLTQHQHGFFQQQPPLASRAA